MACNPKVQYNDFIGDGVQTNYTFTFPYVNIEDVQVRLGDYPDYTYPTTTEYNVNEANPTVLTFTTAPTGSIRIYRCTYDEALEATFQSGSAIRAADLNDNFEQMLFIVQDANIRSLTAQQTTDVAYATAQEALANSEEALAKSIEALAKAEQALELVQDQVLGDFVDTINDLPVTPETGSVYTVVDSTGIENMIPPPNNMPATFVGNPDISVKLFWNGSSYDFIEAFPRDPDNRYVLNNSPTKQYSVRYDDTWVDADNRYILDNSPTDQYSVRYEDTWVDAKNTFLCKDFSIYPLLP